MRLVRSQAGVSFRGEPVGLGGLSVAVVFLERLDLQCRLIYQPLTKLQALFRLVQVEPCERGITAHHALIVVEGGAVCIGVELLASPLQPTLLGTRKLLTQTDRKFG